MQAQKTTRNWQNSFNTLSGFTALSRRFQNRNSSGAQNRTGSADGAMEQDDGVGVWGGGVAEVIGVAVGTAAADPSSPRGVKRPVVKMRKPEQRRRRSENESGCSREVCRRMGKDPRPRSPAARRSQMNARAGCHRLRASLRRQNALPRSSGQVSSGVGSFVDPEPLLAGRPASAGRSPNSLPAESPPAAGRG